jgi:hypothetical protein
MRLAFVARAIFHSSLKAFIRGTVAIALFGAIIIAGSGVARAATVKCPATGILGRGTGVDDLLIDRECHVGDGPYQYANVNIIKPGKLIFASEQRCEDANCGTAGTTPIKRFTNNYCTTAMMSYTDVGHGQDCRASSKLSNFATGITVVTMEREF